MREGHIGLLCMPAIWQTERCLGEEASDLEELAKRRKRALGGESVPLGLADLFFDSDDPLHPDRDDEEDWGDDS